MRVLRSVAIAMAPTITATQIRTTNSRLRRMRKYSRSTDSWVAREWMTGANGRFKSAAKSEWNSRRLWLLDGISEPESIDAPQTTQSKKFDAPGCGRKVHITATKNN